MATFVKESFTWSALNDIHRTQISSGWSPVDISSGVCVLPRTDQAGFISYRGQIKRGLCLTADRSSGVCVLPWQIKRCLFLIVDRSSWLCVLLPGQIKRGLNLAVEKSSGVWVLPLSDEAGSCFSWLAPFPEPTENVTLKQHQHQM